MRSLAVSIEALDEDGGYRGTRPNLMSLMSLIFTASRKMLDFKMLRLLFLHLLNSHPLADSPSRVSAGERPFFGNRVSDYEIKTLLF